MSAARRGRLSAAGLVTVFALATACTTVSATGLRKSSESRPKSKPPPKSPAAPDDAAHERETALVRNSWVAAERAFDTAALRADPSQPDLAETTTAPELGARQALLEQMQATGESATGTTRYGPPTVQLFGSELALVTSCVHDAEIVVSAATGTPVPGVLGVVDFVLLRSTMELSGIGWKLASQTVGVGQCSRS